MAFSLYDWIKGGFKVDDTSVEGIKKLATEILASPNLGNTGSTKTWAKEALKVVNEDPAKAAQFLTGRSNSSSGYFQGRNPKQVKVALKEYESEVSKKLSNYASNLANELDFSNPNLTQEQRDRLTARANAPGGTVAKMAELASGSGLPETVLSRYQAIEKTASGDYVPKGSMGYTPNAHTGESLGINVQPDGQYKVIGRTTGKEYGTFADQSQANAYATEIQSGSKPGVIVTASPEATSDTTIDQTPKPEVTGYQSTILPPGYDLSNFTEQEIKDMEQNYLNAGNSTTIMNKVFQLQDITDEDVKAFYDEASSFISGKGSAYAQQFTRAKENYQSELDYQAEERKRALELERMSAIENRRVARVNLEASGMSTSGEAIRQLGNESGFTDEQIAGMIPTGVLQQQEAAMTSSSKARFEKAISDYGKGVEETLGSANLTGVKVPEVAGSAIFTPTADIRGSLERQQETDIKTKAQELQAAESARRKELLAAQGGVSTI